MDRTSKAGIYIHIPFCLSKCGYCDFYSLTELNLRAKFIQALNREIAIYGQQTEFRTDYDTIYLGGGTPSLLTLQEVEQILAQVRKYFTIHPHAEITLEANPGTLDREKLQDLRSLGINRISIGVQSFIEAELKFLGRIHTVQQAENILGQARAAGFAEISIDLIFAIPGQTLPDWKFSLNRALAFQPEHLSAYNLIIEAGTPFYLLSQNDSVQFFKPDQEAEYFLQAENILQNSGYIHYEVSNYARSDQQLARHNFKYWQHTPYLAFGPSAHSFWPYRRWQNCRSLTDYLQALRHNKAPVVFEEKLTDSQIVNEYILLALRTYQGIDLHQFKFFFNCDFRDRYSRPVELLTGNNLAILDRDHFKLTPRGMLLCDEILPQFAG
jgi:oxygen-independent coproporphyrinogen-3 oxidase